MSISVTDSNPTLKKLFTNNNTIASNAKAKIEPKNRNLKNVIFILLKKIKDNKDKANPSQGLPKDTNKLKSR